MRLYVGNLAYSVTSQSLEQLFSEFGQVKDATVVQDRDTGRSKGFGFVEMSDNGQAQVANSWVSTGPNQDISESELAKSIGSNDINTLAQHTGLSREELLAGLRRELPGAIDELTPNGRVPSPQELSQRV